MSVIHMKLYASLLNLFYPEVSCLACREEAEDDSGICEECWSALEECKPRAISAKPPLSGASAAFCYDGVARQLVRVLKYKGLRRSADVLGGRMAALVDARWGIDALAPVPLHWRRQLERGFNQAELLASVISQFSGIPLKTPLVRLRYTRTQTKLDSAGREKNVREAFQSEECYGNILLIDDVYTTGSTLCSCAQALLDAGARRVYALTAAKVG